MPRLTGKASPTIACLCLYLLLIPSVSTQAISTVMKNQVLFTNVNIFDGKNETLTEGMSVLVEGNKIAKIAKTISPPAEATVINAKGKVLMPGMIDNHWHSLFSTVPFAAVFKNDLGYLTLIAAQANRDALRRGFTTLRDVGGNVFGLARATDQGIVDGPRIYPSGPYISQTSGHGDFRPPQGVPSHPGQPLDYLQATGQTLIADGLPEVIKRTREALRMGATQIKVMAGGGVSSMYDPIDTTQYTFEEMKAIVDVAKTWNTYVTIHSFTDASTQQAIKAGVLSVEHGHLLSDETLKMMADKGVWLSMQPLLDDEDAIQFPEGSENRKKYLQVTSGTERVYKLAKQYHVKIAWGTDTLFDPALAKKQGKIVAKMKRWFTPYEVLKMVTHDNAQLVKLCGPRDPYPGELGVVKEGALADLILVDGNPMENIDLVSDPEKNFVVIMKDGKIYKNTL